jgi:hypothetical protein
MELEVKINRNITLLILHKLYNVFTILKKLKRRLQQIIKGKRNLKSKLSKLIFMKSIF